MKIVVAILTLLTINSIAWSKPKLKEVIVEGCLELIVTESKTITGYRDPLPSVLVKSTAITPRVFAFPSQDNSKIMLFNGGEFYSASLRHSTDLGVGKKYQILNVGKATVEITYTSVKDSAEIESINYLFRTNERHVAKMRKFGMQFVNSYYDDALPAHLFDLLSQDIDKLVESERLATIDDIYIEELATTISTCAGVADYKALKEKSK
ncbi:MAG: hypothetical protein HOE90_03040 [Bacteriovoracaceae bacterium]|jgi:hypothetical protein|nr:hypothetical protein [Bacteriovoracaceae bacterium]